MTTRLTLVCQGATAASRTSAFPCDEPLENRARTILVSSSPPRWNADHIVTSPSRASVETARSLSLDGMPEEGLREIDFGRWACRAIETVARDEGENVARWLAEPDFADHGGESFAALSVRVRRWLALTADQSGHTLAVTHASVIRSLIVHVLDAPFAAFWRIDVAPLSISELRHDGRRWAIRTFGCSLPGRKGDEV